MLKRYYYELDMPNWQLMQNEIIIWLQKNYNFVFNINNDNTGYLPIKNIINDLPIISKTFLACGFTIKYLAIFIKANYKTDLPHTDVSEYDARINFPIINCENSLTSFYTVPENAVKFQGKNQFNMPYSCYLPNTKFTEIASCTINSPKIISIKTLHRVSVKNNSTLPRITATVAVEPDPVSYLM